MHLRTTALALLVLTTSGCLQAAFDSPLTRGQTAPDPYQDKISPQFPVNMTHDGNHTTYEIDLRRMEPTQGRLLRFAIVAYGAAEVRIDVEARFQGPKPKDGCVAYGVHHARLGQPTRHGSDFANVLWLADARTYTGIHALGAGAGATHASADLWPSRAVGDRATNYVLGVDDEVLVDLGTDDHKNLGLNGQNYLRINATVRGDAYLFGARAYEIEPRFLTCGVGASSLALIPAAELNAGPATVLLGQTRSWKGASPASLWVEVPRAAGARRMSVDWRGVNHDNPAKLVDAHPEPGPFGIRFEAWSETPQDAPRWFVVFTLWPSLEARS